MTTSHPTAFHPAAAGAAPALADGDLTDLFALSAHGLLLLDETGRLLRHNPPMQALIGASTQVQGQSDALRQLLGWPAELPPAGVTREVTGWLEGLDGRRRRVRVRVRGLRAQPLPRWLAQFEDRSLEDERDLARIEIAALMGSAGVGVATYDAAQGWVTSAPARQGTRAAESAGGAALMSIGRDVVEPDSLPEYERLQAALRKRERIEVRYAVRHRDTGRRWLMTRVEPAELGPGRPAFSVVTLDVSDEEAARQHNEQLVRELSTILDLNPAGMAYLRGVELVRCNRQFEILLGLPDGSAPGATLETLLVRAGVPGTAARQALSTLALHGSCETEFHLQADAGRAEPMWLSLALRRSEVSNSDSAETVAVLADVTRLRAQQAELEELERERELMFSLSDVGIVYQREGRIERANQAMAELTGHEQNALQGLPMAELYDDERVHLNYAASERREIQLHGRARGERRLLRKDGSNVWVQASVRPVDPHDVAAGTICSFVSVDERRKARETLLAQADRTRAILDSVLVGIVTVGDQGIEWMNRSARRMFGGELADFIGQPISVVAFGEPDHPLRRSDWMATLEEGQAETFECRLTARDGREFWVVGNVVATGRESGAGQLTFALLDIERRREAEHQITRARASLQRIIETAPLAIALFDAGTQQVLQLNQAMSHFARRPSEEILGRPPALWLPGAEAAAISADLHQAMARHEMLRHELRREADPDAAEPARVWDMRIVSLTTTPEGEEQLLLVASDVTEQRAAEQARLEAAIAQREMLVKEVHHRIKNNLQGVAGLLQQNAARHPEVAAILNESVGQVQAIAQVYGLQVGAGGPLRMASVLEAIALSVQRTFGRPVRVQVDGDAPRHMLLPEAESIPIALTVNELLTNAVKHSPQGDVHCRLLCAGDEVRVAIRNLGRLPAGFDLARFPGGVSGLGLVRALLPRRSAAFTLAQQDDEVLTEIVLRPPSVQRAAP